jgi:hypothetical protein
MNQFNAKWLCMRAVNFTNLQDHYEQVAGIPARSSQEDLNGVFLKQINLAVAECERLGLDDVKKKLVRMGGAIAMGNLDASALAREANHAREVFVDALDRMKYVFIEPALTEYVDNDFLFGGSVATAFPSATTDLRSAGNCLATGCDTAAVFHLMRVTELGLRAFCVHLGFNEVVEKYDRSGLGQHEYRPIEYAVWEKIIGQLKGVIDKKIESVADRRLKQEAQEFYIPILQEVWALKEAWRNHVMHARSDYICQDAATVLAHVRRLMVKLATRVSEV